MSYSELARQVTALLAQLLSGSLDGAPEQAATRLLDIVSTRLEHRGFPDVVRNFQHVLGSPANRSRLTHHVEHELADATFRREVALCLDQSTATSSGDFLQRAGRDNSISRRARPTALVIPSSCRTPTTCAAKRRT